MGEYLTQGVTRVAEVESILEEILDLWDREFLEAPDAPLEVEELMDRARTILGRDEEFCAE